MIAFAASRLTLTISLDNLIRTFPSYSQGVDNFIEFKAIGKKVKVFFQLEMPSHKVELRKRMRLLFLNDRIEYPNHLFRINFGILRNSRTQKLKN